MKEANRKRKLEELEKGEGNDKKEEQPTGEKVQKTEEEQEVKEGEKIENSVKEEESIDKDLPDVNMNVEPKVGPIDEERPYKKVFILF